MTDYTWYRGVERLQEVLGVEVDGHYGPETDVAYQLWLAGKFAEGLTETQALQAVDIRGTYIAQITSAVREFRAFYESDEEVRAEADTAAAASGVDPGAIGGGVGEPGAGAPGPGPGAPKTEEKGLPTWGWFLIGMGVLTVGYFGYKAVSKSAKPMSGFGCGCEG